MKKLYEWLLPLAIGISLISSFVFIFFLVFDHNPTYTGPIGDTLGGLLSPVIGIVSLIYIYNTFKEQREQFAANRITDIIYKQFDRINESIKAQLFNLENAQTNTGYNGLYLFNNLIEQKMLFLESPETSVLVANNLNQFTEIYETISTAVVIVENLLVDSNFSENKKDDLREILFLNCGTAIRDNIIRLTKYIEIHNENQQELDIIWAFNQQVDRLSQQIHIVRSVFTKLIESKAI